MTNERAIQILEILISIEGDVIIEGEDKEALEMAIRSLQQEQSCDTCINDKGCVTCKNGELWEGKEYIRKDALLEWVNNAKNSLIIDSTKALQLGKIGSFAILDALIDKLNSM